MRMLSACVGVVVSLLLAAIPAQAVPITYEVQAAVSSGSWTTEGYNGTVIPVGSLASLRWVFDSDTPDGDPSADQGAYNVGAPGEPLEGFVDLDGLELGLVGPQGMTLLDGVGGNFLGFGVSAVPPSLPPCCGGPGGIYTVTVSLIGPQSFLPSSGIEPFPLTPVGSPPLVHGSASLTNALGDVVIAFRVDTIQAVPEPSSAILVAAALAGLSARRSRASSAGAASR